MIKQKEYADRNTGGLVNMLHEVNNSGIIQGENLHI